MRKGRLATTAQASLAQAKHCNTKNGDGTQNQNMRIFAITVRYPLYICHSLTDCSQRLISCIAHYLRKSYNLAAPFYTFKEKNMTLLQCYEAGNGPEVASVMGRKLPTINAGLPTVSVWDYANVMLNSHVPRISLNGKREAASYFGVLGVWIGIFQRATRQNSFLSVIESDCAKLLPI